MNNHVIIMTVFNRPVELFNNTLIGLASQKRKDFDLIIVDDMSTEDYLFKSLASLPSDLRCRTTVLLEDTRKACPDTMWTASGHNNPAYAFNRGLKLAIDRKYPYCWLMSSDLILSNDAILHAFSYEHELDSLCVHGLTHDPLDTNHPNIDGKYVFCGSKRPRPLGWFWGTATKNIEYINGYDEEYVRGCAYDDDDVCGRAVCHIGEVVIDDRIEAHHQHHSSYVAPENSCWINATYTMKKWHGESSPSNGAVNPYHKNVIEHNNYLIRYKVSHANPPLRCKRGIINLE